MPDLLTMVLSFVLQSAQPGLAEAMRPGAAAPRGFAPQSAALPDLGAAVLQCYFATGRFRAVQVLQRPWTEAGQYQADRSAVIRLHWTGGFTGRPYMTDVALMERGGMARGVVLGSNAILPPSTQCALERWQRAS